jgi:hypothetical protein
MEDYTEPDPEETRVTIEVEAPLQERVTERGNFDPDSIERPGFIAVHFQHPGGETGIILCYTGPAGLLADAFDVTEYEESPIVFPFKRKADNGYNFTEYEVSESQAAVEITMTASMYEQVRGYVTEHL